MNIRETWQWRQGRLGELLQLGFYVQMGVEIQDLADRTEFRAPLLHGRECSIVSPDANAIKTCRFFLEFKTKSHHYNWKGGTKDEPSAIPRRWEEGIDHVSFRQYLRAEQRWRQPCVLSILSIADAHIVAATLKQLGEPRISRNLDYDLVNWPISDFREIATFDLDRLKRFFAPQNRTGQDRWLKQTPSLTEVSRMLDWLGTRQWEFADVRQFIFDQTERDWTA